jgi:hypothetical protein
VITWRTDAMIATVVVVIIVLGTIALALLP